MYKHTRIGDACTTAAVWQLLLADSILGKVITITFGNSVFGLGGGRIQNHRELRDADSTANTQLKACVRIIFGSRLGGVQTLSILLSMHYCNVNVM